MSNFIKDLGENIIEKSSSGNSVVFIGKDNIVFQQFLNSNVAERIAKIMLQILEIKEMNYNILFQKGIGQNKKIFLKHTLQYKPFIYIVPFKYYVKEDNVIAWEKITPLNEDKYMLSSEFLTKNFLKIWYDICKALLVLKSIDIIHNDTVLDNIGIYKGNFILFDFDGSGSPEQKGKDFNYDYDTLKKSFIFRDVDIKNMNNIQGINSLIQFVSEKYEISLEEAFKKLENLSIDI